MESAAQVRPHDTMLWLARVLLEAFAQTPLETSDAAKKARPSFSQKDSKHTIVDTAAFNSPRRPLLLSYPQFPVDGDAG